MIDSWERRSFLGLLNRDVEVAAGELLGEPLPTRHRILVAGPDFWAVWLHNARGRQGPPPSEEAQRHARRVSGRA